MGSPYAPRLLSRAWVVAGCAGVGYGIALTLVALRLPRGAELTGQWVAQPLGKAAMAVALTVAAAAHPLRREARWLIGALGCSAAGDLLLAIPWWPPSFIAGLAAFLVAHLCFLGALLPLAVPTRGRWAGVTAVALACLGLLGWFAPQLIDDGMLGPVIVYMGVLAAMVGAALLAGLPTRWTAIGAVFFAVSDAMIGIDRFSPASGWGPHIGDETLAVPIWWAYAAAQLLITAGLFFGRTVGEPGASVREPGK